MKQVVENEGRSLHPYVIIIAFLYEDEMSIFKIYYLIGFMYFKRIYLII